MIAVRNLCSRVVWLADGRVIQNSDTAAVVEEYLQQNIRVEELANIPVLIASLPPDPAFRLRDIKVRQNGMMTNVVFNDKPVEIEIQYTVLQRTVGLRVYFDLLDDHDILIRSFHDDDAEAIPIMELGEYVSIATIPANLFSNFA